MEPDLLAFATELIGGYWPHVSGGAIALGTAIFTYIRTAQVFDDRSRPIFHRRCPVVTAPY